MSGDDIVVLKRPDDLSLEVARYSAAGELMDVTTIETPPSLSIEFGATTDARGLRIAYVAFDRSLGERIPTAYGFVHDVSDGVTRRLDPPSDDSDVIDVRLTNEGILVVSTVRSTRVREAWLSTEPDGWERIAAAPLLQDVALAGDAWLSAELNDDGWTLRCAAANGGGEYIAQFPFRLSAAGIASNASGRVAAAELTDRENQIRVIDTQAASICGAA